MLATLSRVVPACRFAAVASEQANVKLAQKQFSASSSFRLAPAAPSEPVIPPASSFGTNFFRGMGQMAFCVHAGSGLVITSALTVASPVLASAALVGCLSSTATATVLSRSAPSLNLRPEIEMGLYGFNGGLLGAGAFALFPIFSSALSIPQLYALATVGGAATTLVAVGLRPALKTIPFLSIPFNAVMISSILLSRTPTFKPYLQSPAQSATATSPSFTDWLSNSLWSIDATFAQSLGPLQDAFAGCAGMALADKPLVGLGMLAAIALSYGIKNPGAALTASAYTLWGSFLGANIACLLGAPAALVAAGLHGFNPALTALGVYTFVDGKSPLSLFAYISASAAVTTLVNSFATPLAIESLGVGVGALPFCLTTCLAIWLVPRAFSAGLKLRFG